MYSSRFVLLLLAALCVVDAAFLQHFHFGRRDLLDSALNPTSPQDGNQGRETPSGTPGAPTDSKSTPGSTPSSTPSSSSSSTPTSSSSSTSSSTTTTSTTSSTPTSSSVPSQTPSQQPSTEPTSTPTSTPSRSQSTLTTTMTSTSTNATPEATPSKTAPGLSSSKDGSGSGMPPKTRNTIIGVVVGIGGAILLGAMGMVAYRIWGRRKLSEEHDGLMSYDMSTNGYEKHEPSNSISGSQRTPFQSTLENYHQPSNVNASANF